MLATLPAAYSVNQILPSGPAAIPVGLVFPARAIGNPGIVDPFVLICPTLLANSSENYNVHCPALHPTTCNVSVCVPVFWFPSLTITTKLLVPGTVGVP